MQREQHHRPWARLWGKASRERAVARADRDSWHPLAAHSLDVAAAMGALADSWSSDMAWLADEVGLPASQLRSWLVWLAANHDLGKCCDGFQDLVEPLSASAWTGRRRCAYQMRHDSAGYLLLLDRGGPLERWLQLQADGEQTPPGVPPASPEPRSPELRSAGSGAGRSYAPEDILPPLEPWLAASCGHHGAPPILGDHGARQYFSSALLDAADALFFDMTELAPPTRLCDVGQVKELTMASCSWLVAGMITIADWIGSNERWFPYLRGALSTKAELADYWRQTQQRAQQAVAEAGLRAHARPPAGFGALYPRYEPSDCQRAADAVGADTTPGPQLVIIEDLTGSGKTEAALAIASRWIHDGHCHGLYFALPTMATSNAMHGRIRDAAAGWFATEQPSPVVLAHGQARRLRMWTSRERDLDTKEAASTAASGWLEAGTRRALLAPVGVGTIDQALLGVLPVRHQSVRLAGLRGKVLIIDEVHAYDVYVSQLLADLLHAHLRMGGRAILLSATLPRRGREALVSTCLRAMTDQRTRFYAESSAYPLLTQVNPVGTREVPTRAQAAAVTERRTAIAWLDSPEAAIDFVVASARAGRCVAWIRNTVDEARAAVAEVARRLGGAARDGVDAVDPQVVLFHARFAAADRAEIERDLLERFGKGGRGADRAGRVVIATQVIEQSLDVDFDEMVSDLAPIDLLIQRAGRLHRHVRTAAGDPVDASDRDAKTVDGRPAATLQVMAPPWTATPDEDWLSEHWAGTAAVYRQVGLLWLTARILVREGALVLPARARTLVEAVYSEAALQDVPDGLLAAQEKAEAEALAERSVALLNTLPWEQGYRDDGAAWSKDIDTPTRLGPPSTTLRLVVRDEGALSPLRAGGMWFGGDVRVRTAQLGRPQEDDFVSGAALDVMPDKGRYVRVVAGEVDEAGVWRAAVGAGVTRRDLVYRRADGLGFKREGA